MFAKCLIIIFSVIGCSFAMRQYGCPDKHDLAPCTCSSIFTHSVNLVCAKIMDVEVLERVFSKSKGFTFDKLFLQFSAFPYMPIDMFDDVRVVYLDLENVTLYSLFDSTPPKELELTGIEMKNSKLLRGMAWHHLRNQKMKTLRISDSNIKHIGSEFMRNIGEDLNWLEIRNSNVKRLKPGVLKKYRNLNKISFSGNKIRKIERDYFPTPYTGETLEFNYNMLESLPNNLFSQMTNLKFVDFSKNQFNMVPRLNKPSEVWYFYFDDNPLNCNCEIFWLIKSKPGKVKGTCSEPKRLEGRKLDELKRSDFNC